MLGSGVVAAIVGIAVVGKNFFWTKECWKLKEAKKFKYEPLLLKEAKKNVNSLPIDIPKDIKDIIVSYLFSFPDDYSSKKFISFQSYDKQYGESQWIRKPRGLSRMFAPHWVEPNRLVFTRNLCSEILTFGKISEVHVGFDARTVQKSRLNDFIIRTLFCGNGTVLTSDGYTMWLHGLDEKGELSHKSVWTLKDITISMQDVFVGILFMELLYLAIAIPIKEHHYIFLDTT